MLLLDPKGLIAADEKNIMLTAVYLMLIIVIPVIILTILFAWRYRASNTKAVYAPEWSHSTLIEVVCWSVPCIIIGMLATITWLSSHDLDPFKPISAGNTKPVIIEVIALDWKWLFIYPEENIATINYIQFPVNTPVRFDITAEGAMNSFQIPQLAGQIYAMAGMRASLYLIANEEGNYNGMSTNFSGKGFSDMKFIARASSKEEYDNWIKTVKQAKTALTPAEYKTLVTPSINDPVKYYASANESLFDDIVMQNMMPIYDQNNLCNRNNLR